MNQPLVKIESGKPMTTSLALAEYFERKHKTVLEAIREVLSHCSSGFAEQNILPSDYIDKSGRKLPCYRLTFSGFAITAFSFTGSKSVQFREAYITRFNEMEAKLAEKQIKQLESQYVTEKYLPFDEQVIRESVSLSDACKHLRILGVHLTLTPGQLKGKIKRGEYEGHQDDRGHWRIYVDQVTKLATGH